MPILGIRLTHEEMALVVAAADSGSAQLRRKLCAWAKAIIMEQARVQVGGTGAAAESLETPRAQSTVDKPKSWSDVFESLRGKPEDERIRIWQEAAAGRNVPREFASYVQAQRIKWLDENWPLGEDW